MSHTRALHMKLDLDIWSDIACPWCWIGKRHLEAALADARRRLAAKDPAAALRRLGSFREAWPWLGTDARARLEKEEARAIELDERLRTQQRGLHHADALLAMATVNGHRAIGWDDAGTIAVGTRADLVTVRLDTVRAAGAPATLAVPTLVFACTAADVSSVVSGGRQIVADGHHCTIDVVAELDASIKELLA